jgi:streptogramin lyase
MLPPPIALLTPTSTAPFTEWAGPAAAMRVAVAPDGRIWFSDGATSLAVLDSSSNVASYYSLPSGTQALALTVGPNGWIWFTDITRPAVGVLDPASGDVRLWAIPGGGQPFDLVRDSVGNLWYTDRTANAIGRLNPFSNEFTIYPLAGNPQPLFLTLDDEERVWFTADQGNYVGRLAITPVLGPPPTGSFGFTNVQVNLSGPVFGQWKSGQITVSYAYDGSSGLPVWLRVEMLSGGSVVSGFAVTPAQVISVGTGTAVVQISYNGALPASTDQIRVMASQAQWGPAFAQAVISAGPIAWSP